MYYIANYLLNTKAGLTYRHGSMQLGTHMINTIDTFAVAINRPMRT